MSRKSILILLISSIFSLSAYAQLATLKGKITDQEKKPIKGATIRLIASALQRQSEADGTFRFGSLKPSRYLVRFIAMGFASQDKLVELKANDTTLLDIELKPDVSTLREVKIATKSTALRAKEQPENIAVIDAKKYYNRPEGTIAILNQTAGIKVRQSGGLGSNSNFYINGLSGKQVKFFVDGIPLDYLGAGLNLNILPINIIDRIEVYKGVMPVKLGADALGGAINMVTRNTARNYLDAAYAISSFNTHQANINLKKTINKLLFADLTAFYNYSDNNYKVDAELPEAGKPLPYRAKRFHDKFENYYTNLKIGLNPSKWADELSFFTSLAKLDQQIQHNRFMTQPYGEVSYSEKSWNNGLLFKKRDIGQRLSINAFIGLNRLNTHFIDTSLNTYLWNGEAPLNYRRSSGGESGPIQEPRTKILSFLARLNLSFKLNKTSALDANLVNNHTTSNDDNPLTQAYPVKLDKTVVGLAFQKEFPLLRLTSVSAIKYFDYHTRGYIISPADNRSLSGAQASKTRLGFSQALRWRAGDSLLLKSSYEYASRLPDELELFGTYQNRVYPNPTLLPEVSHNINLGVQYTLPKLGFELNGFYRNVSNIIFAPPSSSPFYIIYRNLLKGQITGLDGEVFYDVLPQLRLTVNATWQNYISKTPAADSGTGGNDSHYNERLPNIPFLFANSELLFNKSHIFKKDDRLSLWYNLGYVHWFYLFWGSDGNANQKLTIPTQFTQGAGISYLFNNGRYALSFGVNNLGNAKLTDNYGVQRPGRSFQFKLRTFIQ